MTNTVKKLILDKNGVYVPVNETQKEIGKTHQRLITELMSQKGKRNLPMFAGLFLDKTGIASNINGIKRITGAHDNICVILDDTINFEILEAIINKSPGHYLYKEKILTDRFFQVRRKHIYTIGIPTVVLDHFYRGDNEFEVRKSYLNIACAESILSKYLEKMYGEFSQKNV